MRAATLLSVVRVATLALVAGSLCTATLAAPAGDGSAVEVAIECAGERAAAGDRATVRVDPLCWWEPAAGPYADAVARLAWYDMLTGGLQTRGVIGEYGPRRIWKQAADNEASGAA